MSIEKNTGYFHDGSIIEIKHEDSSMQISMESAQVDRKDLLEPIALSARSTIKGILHIEGITRILENDLPYKGQYLMKTYYSNILNFIYSSEQIELMISWYTIPFNVETRDFSILQINAKKIYWENKPNLVDPYW